MRRRDRTLTGLATDSATYRVRLKRQGSTLRASTLTLQSNAHTTTFTATNPDSYVFYRDAESFPLRGKRSTEFPLRGRLDRPSGSASHRPLSSIACAHVSAKNKAAYHEMEICLSQVFEEGIITSAKDELY